MLKWLIVMLVAVAVVSLLRPRLARWLRLGRLPGDLSLRLRGRSYAFPFASTLLLSLVASLIAWLL
ncbi:MAG: DUF2905 domain-containing protein [Sulfuritalea sp.]|nr:DUF2905 domain-containing protein [Sulfuritalea sp.]